MDKKLAGYVTTDNGYGYAQPQLSISLLLELSDRHDRNNNGSGLF
ncbi:hypothetical protein [Nitrosomonas marina]|nr:hypothetical protein [Nitrosomonas marina]